MLSKKAQYALQALMYMADKNPYQPTLIADISEKRSIPIKFLENILLQLKNAGVLDSKKGKGGGYYFRLAPEDIPLARIIRLIDGPIAMLPCVSLYFYERCKNCNESHCGIHDTMVLVRDATLKILENKTVADLSRSVPLIPEVTPSKKRI
jgi:Rrf2 family protein